MARVFEHSTEDGIRLADRLLFTPEELQDAVLSPGYLLKHQQVVDRLIGERSKSSVNTPTERAFVSVLGALDRMRTKNFRKRNRTFDGQKVWRPRNFSKNLLKNINPELPGR